MEQFQLLRLNIIKGLFIKVCHRQQNKFWTKFPVLLMTALGHSFFLLVFNISGRKKKIGLLYLHQTCVKNEKYVRGRAYNLLYECMWCSQLLLRQDFLFVLVHELNLYPPYAGKNIALIIHLRQIPLSSIINIQSVISEQEMWTQML